MNNVQSKGHKDNLPTKDKKHEREYMRAAMKDGNKHNSVVLCSLFTSLVS